MAQPLFVTFPPRSWALFKAEIFLGSNATTMAKTQPMIVPVSAPVSAARRFTSPKPRLKNVVSNGFRKPGGFGPIPRVYETRC